MQNSLHLRQPHPDPRARYTSSLRSDYRAYTCEEQAVVAARSAKPPLPHGSRAPAQAYGRQDTAGSARAGTNTGNWYGQSGGMAGGQTGAAPFALDYDVAQVTGGAASAATTSASRLSASAAAMMGEPMHVRAALGSREGARSRTGSREAERHSVERAAGPSFGHMADAELRHRTSAQQQYPAWNTQTAAAARGAPIAADVWHQREGVGPGVMPCMPGHEQGVGPIQRRSEPQHAAASVHAHDSTAAASAMFGDGAWDDGATSRQRHDWYAPPDTAGLPPASTNHVSAAPAPGNTTNATEFRAFNARQMELARAGRRGRSAHESSIGTLGAGGTTWWPK